MTKSDLQLILGIVLGIFLLALIVLTVVYIRRRISSRKEAYLLDPTLLSDNNAPDNEDENKGYWINKDDIADVEPARRLRYYHYFDNIDQCIHELIVEMYDCGFVRTEEIYKAAYGEDALTPDSIIYMTDADCDLEKAKAALLPVPEENQRIIYKLWGTYVNELLSTVELHTTEANKGIIKDALLVYGRKKIGILLRSPE
ncbi:MAG: hypothetical protein J6A82_00970 [Coprococcus sp.]|nr:hypothetical protein [Coprococcus sp.]